VTNGEVRDASAETLAFWRHMIEREMARRGIDSQAIPLHHGNVVNGRPAPAIARVVGKVGALSPSALAKVEALADALATPSTVGSGDSVTAARDPQGASGPAGRRGEEAEGPR
jgi:hypothetical protein